MEQQFLGKQSISFKEPVYIQGFASVVGKKEGEGPLGECFDQVEEDEKFGKKTWEEAESMLQQRTARLAVEKTGIHT